MITNRYPIWENEEYSYPAAYGFMPNLMSFLHEDGNGARPCIIVVPGGGYHTVSPTEGELVAKKFFSKGYNAFILTYTTNTLLTEPLKTQPMCDLSRAVRFVRSRAGEFGVAENRIAVCGFSAGGHLCASVCVHHKDIEDCSKAYAGISNRPDAAILSYPVISAGSCGHGDSFRSLYGSDASSEDLEYMSLEKHVDEDTPPCFLWHTATDEVVPVENSLLFAAACKRNGIKHALHIFSEGPHGLSLADSDWAAGNWGTGHTTEQADLVLAAVGRGEIELNDDTREIVARYEDPDRRAKQKRSENKEVAIWPDIAELWLSDILS